MKAQITQITAGGEGRLSTPRYMEVAPPPVSLTLPLPQHHRPRSLLRICSDLGHKDPTSPPPFLFPG